MRPRRHRRRRYAQYETRKRIRIAPIVSAILLFVIMYYAGSKTLQFFGVGNSIRKTAAILTVEDRGVINVALEGGPMKRAEDQLKLYADDRVVSSPRTNASLSFFDGTEVRLDESTQVQIIKSYRAEQDSALTVLLEEGSLWVATPPLKTFSGSITRTIESAYLSITVPAETEAVLSSRSLTVFSAAGLGIEVRVAGTDDTVIIGEGQHFTLPEEGQRNNDLYTYRNPLNPSRLNTPFVEVSREIHSTKLTSTLVPLPTTPEDDTILEVSQPLEGAIVRTSTLSIDGRIGKDVSKVRINGYLSTIDEERRTFTQELALPEEDEVTITIEALNEEGITIAEIIRSISRDREPPAPPSIESPATAGQTYSTNAQEVEIRGTAPEGAIGIMVNDYRLQLFSPGDDEWSYLANTDFDNFTWGENIFEIIAINDGGYTSEPAVLTIILEEEGRGVIDTGEEEEPDEAPEADSVPVETDDEEELIQNDPLMPGAITVFAPAAGEEFTTSENKTEFLIEGDVPEVAHSIWINGYRLRLFLPGRGYWNYIASTELSTLKRGRNTYEITARNKEGQILDSLTYVINFRPGR